MDPWVVFNYQRQERLVCRNRERERTAVKGNSPRADVAKSPKMIPHPHKIPISQTLKYRIRKHDNMRTRLPLRLWIPTTTLNMCYLFQELPYDQPAGHFDRADFSCPCVFFELAESLRSSGDVRMWPQITLVQKKAIYLFFLTRVVSLEKDSNQGGRTYCTV